MSPVLINFGFFIFGWGAKALYDWKVYPAITRSHKREEQREKEAEEEHRREKQKKLDELNEVWRQNRGALFQVEGPLKEFNQINRFPDSYSATTCAEIARRIEEAARKLEGSEYADIKRKFLEYAGRRNQICSTTGIIELMKTFQKDIGGIFEPLSLWHEAEAVLEKTNIRPFSEKDL